MKVYITGIAGFIGFHVAKALRKRGDVVSGCDSFSSYYSPELKRARAEKLRSLGIEIDTVDLSQAKPRDCTHILHLAAQPGVRYSIDHPHVYTETNVSGMLHILERLRHMPGVPLVYASSSSVYGANTKVPFAETDIVTRPVSLYAATKLADEHMAYAYHHLYGIPVTGLRYFTVYGPWGRPDMAYFSFAKAISEEMPIKLFNHGNMERDFTYIDDIVQGTIAALDLAAPCEIFNLGNNRCEPLKALVLALEEALGKEAIIESLPMQPGDVEKTHADIDKAKRLLGYAPQTTLREGIIRFCSWFEQMRPATLR